MDILKFTQIHMCMHTCIHVHTYAYTYKCVYTHLRTLNMYVQSTVRHTFCNYYIDIEYGYMHICTHILVVSTIFHITRPSLIPITYTRKYVRI